MNACKESSNNVRDALLGDIDTAERNYTILWQEREELLTALRNLTRWATHGNKTGNPYCKPEIKQALEAIGKARGRKDWLDAND